MASHFVPNYLFVRCPSIKLPTLKKVGENGKVVKSRKVLENSLLQLKFCRHIFGLYSIFSTSLGRIGKHAFGILSNLTTGQPETLDVDIFPIRSSNVPGLPVSTSTAVNTWRKGSSFRCSKQMHHCNGLRIRTSKIHTHV